MRVNNDVQFRQEANFAPQQRVRMTVDADNMQHIIGLLTDLYSDPMLAVIREYSTNALDSHIAAGNPDPIEVFLPGVFGRSFRVVDKGLGLSVDDIINIYSKYGTSTKRDNDDESGMMGIGCKAGLTYTNQINLTAVKDGVKTVALITRAAAPEVDEYGNPIDSEALPEGTPVIDIIDTAGTNEPNGVEISIPVKDTTTFNRRAKEFFRFWSDGTVLVDGQTPEPIKGLEITDTITVVPNDLESDYVVMGNIGYSVGTRLSGSLPYEYSVVATVKMGEVNFTPNREALHYTPRTDAALRRIVNAMKEGLQAAAQREIEKETSFHAAMMSAQHWRRLTRNNALTYKGQEVPISFTPGKGWRFDTSAYRYAVQALGNYIDVNSAVKGLQVINFPNDSVSSTVRAKAKAYIQEQGLSVRNVYFLPGGSFGGDWLKGLPVVDYSVIKAIKLNRGGKTRTAGEPIPYYVDGTYNTADVDQIPGQSKIVISPAQELSGGGLSRMFPGVTVVSLGKNRWDKFVRENNNTLTIDEALTNAMEDATKSMGLSERLSLSGTSARVRSLARLDATKVVDPELSALVSACAAKVDEGKVARWREIRYTLHSLEIYVALPECPELDALDRYPMLGYYEGEATDHVYEYLNYFYEKDNA